MKDSNATNIDQTAVMRVGVVLVGAYLAFMPFIPAEPLALSMTAAIAVGYLARLAWIGAAFVSRWQ